MNSLNLLSSRVIGRPPRKPRSRSVGAASKPAAEATGDLPGLRRSLSHHDSLSSTSAEEKEIIVDEKGGVSIEVTELTAEPEQESKPSSPAISDDAASDDGAIYDEKTPLLISSKSQAPSGYDLPVQKRSSPQSTTVFKRFANALLASLKWLLSKLLAPGAYVLGCFRSDDGRLTPLAPFRRRGAKRLPRTGSKSTAHAIGLSGSPDPSLKVQKTRKSAARQVPSAPLDEKLWQEEQADGRQSSSSEESNGSRRSIRIKLNAESKQSRPRRRSSQRTASDVAKSESATKEEVAAADLKSPTSPASSLRLTKYPYTPQPPRPLIPRRLPSHYEPRRIYSSRKIARKTLIIDLDETLIHSLAKGGRMSTGHMVEVRLLSPQAYYGGTGSITMGPQHPILYYVHKRPHCDEFLRRVSQWYNLVVFTASVQEYADPVIDWLEQERKYFSARYYRQHCTFRNGAYIKDLSSIEPDLSKVMILDNSPLSYIFHEDNAIPIEGWINDPTDNDLLHLLPLLEGLQYVTDVRALLALRRGEVEATQ